jgi:AIPR protein
MDYLLDTNLILFYLRNETKVINIVDTLYHPFVIMLGVASYLDISLDEQVITDIIISTNNQSPVDLRDLKANDAIQKKLETAIQDLGFSYKRKRENIFHHSDTILASVAAELVLTIWRACPHIAKYKRAELFGKYYDKIFTELNASQTIIAVLIFRFCDNQRRRESLIERYPHLSII